MKEITVKEIACESANKDLANILFIWDTTLDKTAEQREYFYKFLAERAESVANLIEFNNLILANGYEEVISSEQVKNLYKELLTLNSVLEEGLLK